MLAEAWVRHVADLPAAHFDRLEAHAHLASARLIDGDLAEARSMFDTLHERAQSTYGDQHPLTLELHFGRTMSTVASESYAGAEAHLRDVLHACVPRLGDAHPHVLSLCVNLASCVRLQWRYVESEAIERAVLARLPTAPGADAYFRMATTLNLARSIVGQGRHVEASTLLCDAIVELERVFGAAHPLTRIAADQRTSLCKLMRTCATLKARRTRRASTGTGIRLVHPTERAKVCRPPPIHLS